MVQSENIKPIARLSAVNVIVGKVTDIKPHPYGDRIRIAVVVYSLDEKQSEVIFGGNMDVVEVGSLVAFAPPTKSCRVLGKKLRRQTFRGITSYGELCSLFELGISLIDTDEVAILCCQHALGTPITYLLDDLQSNDELWHVFKRPTKHSVNELFCS